MSENENLLEALKHAIIEMLQSATDTDLLDYVYKLLVVESGQ